MKSHMETYVVHNTTANISGGAAEHTCNGRRGLNTGG